MMLTNEEIEKIHSEMMTSLGWTRSSIKSTLYKELLFFSIGSAVIQGGLSYVLFNFLSSEIIAFILSLSIAVCLITAVVSLGVNNVHFRVMWIQHHQFFLHKHLEEMRKQASQPPEDKSDDWP